jgi:REP element-mobilizing transposase RayT
MDKIIQETVKIRKEVILDEYIIMPNHVHVLISISVGNAGLRSDNDVTKNIISNYVQ